MRKLPQDIILPISIKYGLGEILLVSVLKLKLTVCKDDTLAPSRK